MSRIGQDLRYALRALRRTPGFTLAAIGTLTLGIGLTTAMFSIVYGVLLKGLPYPNGNRLVVAYRESLARGVFRQAIPLAAFQDYRREQRTLAALGGYLSGAVNISGDGPAARAAVTWVTADLFRVLDVPPLVGRVIGDGDDGPAGAAVVVIGYSMWRDRFGSAPDIVGRAIRVDGVQHTVVGVMPRGFAFPDAEALWLPLRAGATGPDRAVGPVLVAIGRLRPGMSIGMAQADLAGIAGRLAGRYPKSDGEFTATAGTFSDWSIGPQPRRLLLAMLGAVFCVFLVACINVMNLLVGRAYARVREFGVRIALGASRAQVASQVLAEALFLAGMGAAGGLAIAGLGIGAFHRATMGTNFPSFVQVGLFPPVLAFAGAIGVLATLASGLIPALKVSSRDISDVLKDGSRAASGLSVGRTSRVLVGLEVALSAALLVAAGLMVETVIKARTVNYGYATTSVLTGGVTLPDATEDTRVVAVVGRIERAVRAIPGVRTAGVTSGLPGVGLDGDHLALDGATYASPEDQPTVDVVSVTPGFFDALGLATSRGRPLSERDRLGAVPVAVVSERLVRRLFPGDDALGKRVRLGAFNGRSPWVTIVGVVPDIFGGDPVDPYPAIVFLPFAQAPSHTVFVGVRAAARPLALVPAVRAAVASVDPDLPLDQPTSLAKAISAQLWFIGVFGTMFTIFGGIALALATIGLYAVTASWVGQRTRELGIRMALGAGRGRVLRLVLRQGAVPVVAGLLVGLALALGVSRLLADILFDVQPRDPVVFGGVAFALVLSALCACLVPAIHATGLTPMSALRRE